MCAGPKPGTKSDPVKVQTLPPLMLLVLVHVPKNTRLVMHTNTKKVTRCLLPLRARTTARSTSAKPGQRVNSAGKIYTPLPTPRNNATAMCVGLRLGPTRAAATVRFLPLMLPRSCSCLPTLILQRSSVSSRKWWKLHLMVSTLFCRLNRGCGTHAKTLSLQVTRMVTKTSSILLLVALCLLRTVTCS